MMSSTQTLAEQLAQAERLQLYDHRALQDPIARANGHRGTKRRTEAVAGDPQFTRGELEALMNKLAITACRSRSATPPSSLMTASPTRLIATSQRIASSSKPTGGRPTAPATPSSQTAPKTPPWPRRPGR